MNYDLDDTADDAHVERQIQLDAMSDPEIEREYERQFRQLPSRSSTRFDMIEGLLAKLAAELHG